MAIYSTRCKYDGYNFDSLTERDFYIKLKILKSKNQIKDFSMQVPFRILEEFKDFDNAKVPAMDYIIDFKVVLNDNQEIYIDTKGDQEEVARLKAKMFMNLHKDLPLYFISVLPKYLGNEWVEVTKSKDFRSKLKNKYQKIHGKWKRNQTPNWSVKEWEKYFEFKNMYGLFYKWTKTKTVK